MALFSSLGDATQLLQCGAAVWCVMWCSVGGRLASVHIDLLRVHVSSLCPLQRKEWYPFLVHGDTWHYTSASVKCQCMCALLPPCPFLSSIPSLRLSREVGHVWKSRVLCVARVCRITLCKKVCFFKACGWPRRTLSLSAPSRLDTPATSLAISYHNALSLATCNRHACAACALLCSYHTPPSLSYDGLMISYATTLVFGIGKSRKVCAMPGETEPPIVWQRGTMPSVTRAPTRRGATASLMDLLKRRRMQPDKHWQWCGQLSVHSPTLRLCADDDNRSPWRERMPPTAQRWWQASCSPGRRSLSRGLVALRSSTECSSATTGLR
jgi:hypothetical protein